MNYNIVMALWVLEKQEKTMLQHACLWFPRVVDCLVGEPLDMAEGRNIDCGASVTEDRVPSMYPLGTSQYI